MSDITSKPIKAARMMLERNGYEIVEQERKTPAGIIDIIAKENGCLVFVDVEAVWDADEAFPAELQERRNQADRENQAFSYIMQTDAVDMPFRFDTIDLHVIGATRAMLRHGKGVITGWDAAFGERESEEMMLDEAA